MPAITHVHNLAAPEPPDVCEVVIYPVAVVPFALAALEYRIPVYVWEDASYARGVQLVRSLQMALLCGGVKEITERQDALYRMLGTAIYGTDYSVVSTDPDLVIEPPIEPTHNIDFVNPDSILGRMEDARQLAQNAMNGTSTDLYSEPLGVRELLANLITAVQESGGSNEDILAQLVNIAGLLA